MSFCHNEIYVECRNPVAHPGFPTRTVGMSGCKTYLFAFPKTENDNGREVADSMGPLFYE